MSFLDVIKSLGQVAAPIVGTALAGPLGGAAGGALSGLIGGGGVGGAAEGAVMGGAGGALMGKDPSGWASKLGGMFQGANGQIDPGKIVGTAGGIMDMIGKNQQRTSAQNYANSQIDQRNKLMSSILSPQSYNLPNLDQQSTATRGM